jgi:Ca2+-binding RTX toxin-like protein
MAGGDGGDSMYGNLGDDTVGGEAGADHIEGNEEGDDLFDGFQVDTVIGGAGSDVLYRCADGVSDSVSGVETLLGPSDFYC